MFVEQTKVGNPTAAKYVIYTDLMCKIVPMSQHQMDRTRK